MNLPTSVDNLRIVYYPDPVLRKNCEPVTSFDDQLAAIIDKMEELMFAARGVGLAAPQVGLPIRLFLCNPTGDPEDTTAWINPQLSDLTGAAEGEEGCLSLPGVTVNKRRAEQLLIKGQDVNGDPISEEGSDLLARIWQHENDHLNGVLVIDGMSESDNLANRRAVKQLEQDFSARKR